MNEQIDQSQHRRKQAVYTVIAGLLLCLPIMVFAANDSVLERELQHLRQRISQLRIEMQRNDKHLREIIKNLEKRLLDLEQTPIQSVTHSADQGNLLSKSTTLNAQQKKAEIKALEEQLQQLKNPQNVDNNSSTPDLPKLNSHQSINPPNAKGSLDQQATDILEDKRLNHSQAHQEGIKDARTLYNTGIDLLSKSNYKDAQTIFSQLVTDYPQSPYVADARYLLGETFYFQENFNAAYTQYNTLVTDFPDSDKVGVALLKSGFSKMEMAHYRDARDIFIRVVEQYPQSRLSQEANHKLGLIRILQTQN